MRTFVKKTFWIIFTVWISATLATEIEDGHGQICGVVLDQDDQPLEKCSVYQGQTGAGAVSDDTGFFKIPDLPPGNYSLILECEGYESFCRSIEVEAGKISYFSVSLTKKEFEKMETGRRVLVNRQRTGSWWTVHFDENENPLFSLD